MKVPEKEWRGEGAMMDKRTVRKVHGAVFAGTIASCRQDLLRLQSTTGSRNTDVTSTNNIESTVLPSDLPDKEKSFSETEEGGDNDNADEDNKRAAPLRVCIRKRPVLPSEKENKEFDVVTCYHNNDKKDEDCSSSRQQRNCIAVHACQMCADMKQKYVETHHYQDLFARCYDETETTDAIYDDVVAKDIFSHAVRGGEAVCMMYGQTGSGKTFTAEGIQNRIAQDLFPSSAATISNETNDGNRRRKSKVSLSVFEIAGSKICDLLNKREKLKVCEDRDGTVHLLGLKQEDVEDSESFLRLLRRAKEERATESTAVNDVSSRSHAIYQIRFFTPSSSCYNKENGDPTGSETEEATTTKKEGGRLTLVDLAGSERNENSFLHSAGRIRETIEINTSHMALKQCIRTLMDNNGNKNDNENRPSSKSSSSSYVPYRASVLTRVLKDSLWADSSKAVVIATVSPIPVDTEHTLSTLEYAAKMATRFGDDDDGVTLARRERRDAIEKVGDTMRPTVVPIKNWTHNDVVNWWKSLEEERLREYAPKLQKSLNGKQLLRLGPSRFKQICDGNEDDAANAMRALRDLRKEQNRAAEERRHLNRSRDKNRRE